MGTQIELQKETGDYAAKLKKELPSVITAHHAFRDEVYKDGALSFKTKHLMALAASMRAGRRELQHQPHQDSGGGRGHQSRGDGGYFRSSYLGRHTGIRPVAEGYQDDGRDG